MTSSPTLRSLPRQHRDHFFPDDLNWLASLRRPRPLRAGGPGRLLSIGPGGSGDWPRGPPSRKPRGARVGCTLGEGGARRRVGSRRCPGPPARPPSGPSCSPPAGQGRRGPAMESYDIIANQPVVIDNVRPGSQGEGGRPAPGGARGGAGRDPRPPRRVLRSLLGSRPRWAAGVAPGARAHLAL